MPEPSFHLLSVAERERILLAPYAFHSENTSGRRYPETSHPYRGPFQRDRDRIIHCAAYRRLGEKMQVFTAEFGNYHRTRLTHTQEVVSIARTLGRALSLNEDFIEAAALLHDIGHPPFGHSGESVLDSFLSESGGFDHNRQALRIVEKLERRYPDFPGLNLSREILDGQEFKCHKNSTPRLEIQVVDVADSIAYDTHDVDDAMEIGLLHPDQFSETSLWRQAAKKIRDHWIDLDDTEFRQAVVHELIETQVSDVLRATERRLMADPISSSDEAVGHSPFVMPSSEISQQKSEAEAFLLQHVYRHPNVMLHRGKIRDWVETVFHHYESKPEELPRRYESVLKHDGPRRAAADCLADMTDKSARLESFRLSKDVRSPIEKNRNI